MVRIGAAAIFAALILSFQNCGAPQQTSSPPPQSTQVANSIRYFQRVQQVHVDVFYEPNAAPFTGTTGNGYNYWSVLEENLNAIFQYRSARPSVTVPKSLSSMTVLPAQNKATWTAEDILALHARSPGVPESPEQARFKVYFLRGHYSENGATKTGVIGVSIGGTPVIAMFKSVIESTGAHPNGAVPKFVEQSTLVHEIGHALGLVNNGIPMASPHQDTAHGSHTVNSDCVMFWQNEGASDLVLFVQKYMSSSSRVMWGPEVLADVRAISR